jgi:hypothetical protein
MIVRWAVALSLAALACAPAPAPAVPVKALSHYRVSRTRVYGDGGRWAAYEERAGRVVIADSLERRSFVRRNPRGCEKLAAAGAGELLFVCDCPHGLETYAGDPEEFGCFPPNANAETKFWSARLVVESIASGRLRALITDRLPSPGRFKSEALVAEGALRVEAIGSQWVEILQHSYSYPTHPAIGMHPLPSYDTRVFLNWHTGKIQDALREPPTSAREYEDLDSPALLVPLCRPLERAGGFTGEQPGPFDRVIYRSGFMLTPASGILARCGTTSRERIEEIEGFPLTNPSVGGSLGSGVLSWLTGVDLSEVCTARLKQHGARLRGPRHCVAGFTEQDEASVVHTLTTVYESGRGPGKRPYTVASAPIV